MKDDLDKDETINDENSSDSFLKIEPIKEIDISNIKIETIQPEIKNVETKKENVSPNNKDIKDNSKIMKIIIAILVLILCLGGGYFAYSKFIANNESGELATNTVIEEVVQETPQEDNSLAALAETIVENSQDMSVEEEQDTEISSEEPVVEEQEIIQEENNSQVDDYDLMLLETVYNEVINKGNEGYLYNFSSDELAIIRNTLYARRGYKFKKKKYQNYFGSKSWYVPTTDSQNILTKKEEKLANIIKRYE